MHNQQSLTDILHFLTDEQQEVRVNWKGEAHIHKKEPEREVWQIFGEGTVGKITYVAKDFIWLEPVGGEFPEIIPLRQIRRIRVHGRRELIDKFKGTSEST